MPKPSYLSSGKQNTSSSQRLLFEATQLPPAPAHNRIGDHTKQGMGRSRPVRPRPMPTGLADKAAELGTAFAEHAPDGATAFTIWAQTVGNDRVGRIAQDSIQHYRYIWQQWCLWLAQEQEPIEAPSKERIKGSSNLNPRINPEHSYLRASPERLWRFLEQSPQPSIRRRTATKTSSISRYRYGLYLRSMYEFFCQSGWTSKPLLTRHDVKENPSVDDRSSVNLSANAWRALQIEQGRIASRSLIDIAMNHAGGPNTGSQDYLDAQWLELRDACMILLIMDTGLTSAEVRHLLRQDIALQSNTAPSLIARDVDAGVARYVWGHVSISAQKTSQCRRIAIESAWAVKALQGWLAVSRPVHDHTDLAFPSKNLTVMHKRVIFDACANAVQQACAQSGMPTAHHLGPNIIRNTAMSQWAAHGLSRQEIAAKAGISDTQSLNRMDARCWTTQPA